MSKSFFWLHIKKSGGHSFRKAFEEVYIQTNRLNAQPFIAIPKNEWNDNLNNYLVPLGEYQFKRSLFAKNFLYPEDWENMFKFTIVRNPYSRAVSSWLYHKKYTPYTSKIKHLIKNPYAIIDSKIDFQIFLEKIPEAWSNIEKSRHLATHTAPIIPDITDDDNKTILLDFIGKIENINSDLDYIGKKIGISNIKFPILNTTDKKKIHYSFFYNKKNRNLVEQYYGDDIEALKYSFEEK